MTPQPVRYLVLWLTTQCNLHCSYCYRPPEAPSRMSPGVARAALELAASSGQPFHVQLAGGEPTLEPELIEYIGSLIREKRLPASVAVQTNGTRIDARLIAACLQHQIEIGISLDGPPDMQQRARGMARETYQGLALLDASAVPTRVTAVLSSESLASAPALAMCLASFSNIRGFGFDPLVLKGAARGRADLLPACADTCDAAHRICETLALVNRRRRQPLVWREFEAVKKARSIGQCSTHYCHAARGESMAVHPSGAVFPCSQVAGEPEFAAGTLDAVDWNRLAMTFRDVRIVCRDADCRLAGRCPGDCPSRIHFQNPAMTPVMCDLYRGIADYLAEEAL
jgi:uncharacterized protein